MTRLFGSVSWLLLFLPAAAAAPSQDGFLAGPRRRPDRVEASDRTMTHTEHIKTGRHKYVVQFNGTVDGVMTRDPVGYAAYRQGFQPNLYVTLKNVGDTRVVNPRLIANGKRDWRTVQDIVAEATRGCATDREKAIAIWEFEKRHRFHATTGDRENNDPVKMYNILGYTLCGNDAQVIADLWRTAGLKTRRGRPVGHSTSECFFDGRFHLLDGDENIIVLHRDNRTIASESEIVHDHDLMKRTHTYSLLSGESRKKDEGSAALHYYEGPRTGEHRSHIGHTMRHALRPNESITWRWDHVGKHYRKRGYRTLQVWEIGRAHV